MRGLPTMVFALAALTLLAASCVAAPRPVAFAGPADAAPQTLTGHGPLMTDADSKAEAKDLEASETFGYGYRAPLTHASYYGYPYSYRYYPYYYRSSYWPYSSSYWDDWNSYYYWW